MPEGDTVHRTADRLNAALAGRVVEHAELRWPSVPDVDLAGSRTVEVVARGKHLLHRFDTGSTLHTHLRMEGQWRVEHPGERTRRALRRHDVRAAVLTDTWSAVGLRLGMLDLVPTARESDLVGHLGPDVLGPDWDVELAAAGSRHPAGSSATRCSTSGCWPGWARSGPARSSSSSGCCPGPPPPTSTPCASWRCSSGCTASWRWPGARGWQASTGIQRSGEEAYVHARSGRPCRRCGDTVRVAVTGVPPRERTMFSCPTCQGGLAPGDDGRRQSPLGSTGSGAYRARR